jgi:GTP-sensing pleiotropic transcriptional regulator CodY
MKELKAVSRIFASAFSVPVTYDAVSTKIRKHISTKITIMSNKIKVLSYLQATQCLTSCL